MTARKDGNDRNGAALEKWTAAEKDVMDVNERLRGRGAHKTGRTTRPVSMNPRKRIVIPAKAAPYSLTANSALHISPTPLAYCPVRMEEMG